MNWNKIFDELDENHSGKLEMEELNKYLKTYLPTISRAEVEDDFNSFDLTQDGIVTKSEFLTVMENKTILEPKEVVAAFKTFDKDGSGFLSKDELAAAMKSKDMDYSNKEVQKLIESVSKDDKIDIDEFVAAMY